MQHAQPVTVRFEPVSKVTAALNNEAFRKFLGSTERVDTMPRSQTPEALVWASNDAQKKARCSMYAEKSRDTNRQWSHQMWILQEKFVDDHHLLGSARAVPPCPDPRIKPNRDDRNLINEGMAHGLEAPRRHWGGKILVRKYESLDSRECVWHSPQKQSNPGSTIGARRVFVCVSGDLPNDRLYARPPFRQPRLDDDIVKRAGSASGFPYCQDSHSSGHLPI